MDPGRLIRMHRRRRRFSQLELAAAAGISARHLSFIENGRSRPGRAVLAALARAMGLPAREVNVLMRAAGERSLYPEHGLEGEAAAPLRWAVERMLEAHMPLPAIVTDHAWCLVRANPAFAVFHERLLGHTRAPVGERSLMEWVFAADGLRPLVSNWDAVGPFLLDRVRRESVVHPDLDGLVERLQAALDDSGIGHAGVEGEVVLPLRLRLAERELQLFSILAGFGSVLDAGLQALRMEYFFPADEATRAYLEGLTAEIDA